MRLPQLYLRAIPSVQARLPLSGNILLFPLLRWEAGYAMGSESEGNGCMDTLDESEDGRTQWNASPPVLRVQSPVCPPARCSESARRCRHFSSLHFTNLGCGGRRRGSVSCPPRWMDGEGKV